MMNLLTNSLMVAECLDLAAGLSFSKPDTVHNFNLLFFAAMAGTCLSFFGLVFNHRYLL